MRVLVFLLFVVVVFAASGNGAVADQQASLDGVEKRIEMLNNTIKELKQVVSKVNQTVINLTKTVGNLERWLRGNATELGKLRGQLGGNWTRIQELNQAVAQRFVPNMTRLERLLSNVERELGFLRLLVVVLGVVAVVATAVAVLAWRKAGRASVGGVEVCG